MELKQETIDWLETQVPHLKQAMSRLEVSSAVAVGAWRWMRYPDLRDALAREALEIGIRCGNVAKIDG